MGFVRSAWIIAVLLLAAPPVSRAQTAPPPAAAPSEVAGSAAAPPDSAAAPPDSAAALPAIAPAPGGAASTPATAPAATTPSTLAATAPSASAPAAQRGWLARWLAPPPGSDPLAGYSNGNLFLRDKNSWFVVFIKGRLQVDFYGYAGRAHRPDGVDENSPKDPNLNLKNTVFLRRARVALAGTILKYFDFFVENEFATVPATGALGTLTDASITVNYLPYLQLEFGQLPVPFTIDNRTSENYGDFMERGLISRAFASPNTRDIGALAFGWLPRHVAYYSIGVFNGDGQNFKNQDNYPAVIGRAFVAPLAALPRHARWVEDIWVGGSYWWQKNSNVGGFVTPSTSGASQNDLPSLTTQGGASFFSANYANGVDAAGNAIRSHLAPDGITQKYALELNVPIKYVGVRAEWAHQSIDLRQYNDLAGTNGALTRTRGPAGNLSGDAYYVELYGWILGDVNFLDTPGHYPKPHWRGYTPPPPPKLALSLSAKYEHVGLQVKGLTTVAATDTATDPAAADPAAGRYALDVFELGANLWLTRHLRLAGNYAYNYFNNGSGLATNAAKNAFTKHAEHEILLRLQIAL